MKLILFVIVIVWALLLLAVVIGAAWLNYKYDNDPIHPREIENARHPEGQRALKRRAGDHPWPTHRR